MMQFTFGTNICKSELAEDGKRYLIGVASSTGLDKQRERFAPEAIQQMAKGMIGNPLTNSHDAKLGDIIGTVVDTRVTDDDKLIIKAEIDDEDPEAVRLFEKVRKGHRAAFSVGGRVVESVPGTNGARRVITKIDCGPDAKGHVCLTNNPANTDSWAQAILKSLDAAPVDDEAAIEKAADISIEENDGTSQAPVAKAQKDAFNMTFDELFAQADNELAKEGRVLSAETQGKLLEIKSKLEELLGIATPVEAEEVSNDDGDGDNDGTVDAKAPEIPASAPEGVGENTPPVLDINKEDAEKPSFSKEQISEIASFIKEALAEALPQIKSDRKSVVSNDAINKTEDALNSATDIHSLKSAFFKSL